MITNSDKISRSGLGNLKMHYNVLEPATTPLRTFITPITAVFTKVWDPPNQKGHFGRFEAHWAA